MSESVTRHDADGFSTLTLNRPDKLNALDTSVFEALDAHLAALDDDSNVGCVVLRGGGKGVCAGADLNVVGAANEKPANYKPGVIDRLSRLRIPVIAAVHGVCFTGG